jgi:hypothetical protein
MLVDVIYIIVVAGFFVLFGVALWRMAGGPSNDGAELGHNAPPRAEVGDMLDRMTGHALGTPESLVGEDDDAPRNSRDRRHG